jgi:hypothetical protein
MKLEINENTIVSANTQQVTGDLPDGDVVILSLENGVYYGLNEVGAHIWKLIQQQLSVRQLSDTLLGEYDVDAEQCYQEVVRLLHELLAQGLLNVERESVIAQ